MGDHPLIRRETDAAHVERCYGQSDDSIGDEEEQVSDTGQLSEAESPC
jgi:hypothetical protein